MLKFNRKKREDKSLKFYESYENSVRNSTKLFEKTLQNVTGIVYCFIEFCGPTTLQFLILES